jgi:hypothetical protein
VGETFTEQVARTLAENHPRAAVGTNPVVTRGRSTQMAIDATALLGAAGGPAPPGMAPPDATGSITSRHEGSDLDHIRTAILALQAYAEGLHDDQELQAVMRCIAQLQGLLASAAKDKEAALGTTAAMKHIRRTARGAGY